MTDKPELTEDEMAADELAAAELCENLKKRPPHGEVHNHPCCFRTGHGETMIRCTSAGQVLYTALKRRKTERLKDHESTEEKL